MARHLLSALTLSSITVVVLAACEPSSAALRSKSGEPELLKVDALPDNLVCGPFPTMLPGPQPDPFITTAVFNTVEFSGLNTPGETVIEETYTYFNPETKTLDHLKGSAKGPTFRYTQKNPKHFDALALKLIDLRYNKEGIFPLPWNFISASSSDNLKQSFDHQLAPLTRKRLTNVQDGIVNIVASSYPFDGSSAPINAIAEYSFGFYQLRRDNTPDGLFRMRSGHTKTTMEAAKWDFSETLNNRRDYLDLPDSNMTLQYGNTKAHFEATCAPKGHTDGVKKPLERLATAIHPALTADEPVEIGKVCESRLFRIVQLGLLRSSNNGLYDSLIGFFADPSQDPQKVMDANSKETPSDSPLGPVGDARLKMIESLEVENDKDYQANPQTCFVGYSKRLNEDRQALERPMDRPSSPGIK